MRSRELATLFLLTVLAIGGLHERLVATSGRQASRELQELEGILAKLRHTYAIPGLSAAIVEDGRLVWEYAAGFEDLGTEQPATPATLYPVASLTKTFTSTLLLQCVERGTLSLDTPIRQFTTLIPESDATVRHVLSHTSMGRPGERFTYDGDRFLALTPVVERCTGLPYRLALTTLILDPVGMRESVPGHDLENPAAAARALFPAEAIDRYSEALTRLATPYLVDERGRPAASDYPPRGINASAGLVSTVRDLARYDAALDDHLLLTESMQRLAWLPSQSSGRLRRSLPYGLGWFVQGSRSGSVIWHYGFWAQFSSLYVKLPQQRRTFLILANSGGLSARFPLAQGDLLVSPFAKAFLSLRSR